MLSFKDKEGKIKFVIKDEDTAPMDVDKILIDDLNKKETLEKENNNGTESR